LVRASSIPSEINNQQSKAMAAAGRSIAQLSQSPWAWLVNRRLALDFS
jgi:hypothetical protein